MNQTPMKTVAAGLLLGLLLALDTADSSPAATQTLTLPDDPRHSITYWKPHVIAPQNDPLVAQAHSIFAILLRAWDSSRLEPSLYVVASTSGPWAASLADGSILLTRAALDTIMAFDNERGERGERGEHLLAFVLGHELAHQRADDLWHQRFFRLIGDQQPEIKRQIAVGLHLNTGILADMEQKEAQADHDGLLMMSSVGFDPYQILDQKDFFTAWVENIWQGTCRLDAADAALADACRQAQTRALRTRTQLAAVATQSMLYELGIQAFVAGNHSKARRFFTAYGRNYTNRAVLTAVALTHFYEALAIQKELISEHGHGLPAFYYPLLLDATALASPPPPEGGPAKRAATQAAVKQAQPIIQAKVDLCIGHLEKALRLEPDHPKTYLLLASSYLLSGNTHMVRGIIKGKYIPRFGEDTAAKMLLAMTIALEGRYDDARQAFAQLIDNLERENRAEWLPDDLLRYAAYHNFAALESFLGQGEKVRKLWESLARQAKQTGDGMLFQLCLNQLKVTQTPAGLPHKIMHIDGYRIGDRLPAQEGGQKGVPMDELWLEGEQLRILRLDQGSRFVLDRDDRIIGAWQDAGALTLGERIAIGDEADRPIKSWGIPDRRLHLMSGEYLAYDKQGVAMRIEDQKVVGWFLYPNR